MNPDFVASIVKMIGLALLFVGGIGLLWVAFVLIATSVQ